MPEDSREAATKSAAKISNRKVDAAKELLSEVPSLEKSRHVEQQVHHAIMNEHAGDEPPPLTVGGHIGPVRAIAHIGHDIIHFEPAGTAQSHHYEYDNVGRNDQARDRRPGG